MSTETDSDSQLMKYAREELKLAGLMDGDDDYDGLTARAVLEIIEVFSKQGHSGYSASLVLQIIEKLMRYEPLTPLTFAPDEWNEVGTDMWQNRRKSEVFSTDGGRTWYDLQGNKGVGWT